MSYLEFSFSVLSNQYYHQMEISYRAVDPQHVVFHNHLQQRISLFLKKFTKKGRINQLYILGCIWTSHQKHDVYNHRLESSSMKMFFDNCHIWCYCGKSIKLKFRSFKVITRSLLPVRIRKSKNNFILQGFNLIKIVSKNQSEMESFKDKQENFTKA